MDCVIDLDDLVREANDLAPLADSASRLLAIAAKEQWDIREVLDAISYDQVLTSRMLRVANSAACASYSQTTTVRDAVVRLGMGTVVAIAIASSVRSQLQQAIAEYGLTEGALWRHSVAAALAADTLRRECRGKVPAEAFTAALLHDIGKLVLARFLTPDLLRLLRRAGEEAGLPILDAEAEVIGVHHAELGGIIAQHWSLPQPIVLGVIHHHAPANGQAPICDAVHLADVVASRVGAGLGEGIDAALDEGALARLGTDATRLDAVCETVAEQLDEVTAAYS